MNLVSSSWFLQSELVNMLRASDYLHLAIINIYMASGWTTIEQKTLLQKNTSILKNGFVVDCCSVAFLIYNFLIHNLPLPKTNCTFPPRRTQHPKTANLSTLFIPQTPQPSNPSTPHKVTCGSAILHAWGLHQGCWQRGGSTQRQGWSFQQTLEELRRTRTSYHPMEQWKQPTWGPWIWISSGWWTFFCMAGVFYPE